MTPSGRPTIAVRNMAASATSAVAGAYLPKSSSTGWPVRIEVPRSPWARSTTQYQVLFVQGLVQTVERLSSSTWSPLARMPATALMGSAGTMCETTKVISEDPDQGDNHPHETLDYVLKTHDNTSVPAPPGSILGRAG